jgi:hypothetical protein
MSKKGKKRCHDIAGFRVGPASAEDWLELDGKWHHVVYVFLGEFGWGLGLPLVYVDGRPVAKRSESALYSRALSPEEVAEHFHVARPGTYHEVVERTGGKFIDLGQSKA